MSGEKPSVVHLTEIFPLPAIYILKIPTEILSNTAVLHITANKYIILIIFTLILIIIIMYELLNTNY